MFQAGRDVGAWPLFHAAAAAQRPELLVSCRASAPSGGGSAGGQRWGASVWRLDPLKQELQGSLPGKAHRQPAVLALPAKAKLVLNPIWDFDSCSPGGLQQVVRPAAVTRPRDNQLVSRFVAHRPAGLRSWPHPPPTERGQPCARSPKPILHLFLQHRSIVTFWHSATQLTRGDPSGNVDDDDDDDIASQFHRQTGPQSARSAR